MDINSPQKRRPHTGPGGRSDYSRYVPPKHYAFNSSNFPEPQSHKKPRLKPKVNKKIVYLLIMLIFWIVLLVRINTVFKDYVSSINSKPQTSKGDL